jgi:hypothetical protein
VRLWVGTIVQGALGVLLIVVALSAPPAGAGWLLVLLAAGAAALWNAWGLWKTRRRRLVLTREALSDDTGVRLCAIADVESVARGVFALKPARGFALTLKAPAPRAWVPGLWWRIGARLGVGGVTSAAEARLMAEMIEVLLAERRAGRG